jgi:hypothetical protein
LEGSEFVFDGKGWIARGVARQKQTADANEDVAPFGRSR